MSIVLYDLAFPADRRPSPFCWRARMALAHKGLDHRIERIGFGDVPNICGGGHKTVPVIDDGGKITGDSARIADYLEATYPDRPSLYGGPAGRAYARFMENWVGGVQLPLFLMIVADLWSVVGPEDQAYFRESREKRFAGKTLEQVQEGREDRVEAFRKLLQPVRSTLAVQPFLGGDTPTYADYVLFGTLQWSRVASPFRILAEDDAVLAWFRRVLDLHGGVGRDVTGYWE